MRKHEIKEADYIIFWKSDNLAWALRTRKTLEEHGFIVNSSLSDHNTILKVVKDLEDQLESDGVL